MDNNHPNKTIEVNTQSTFLNFLVKFVAKVAQMFIEHLAKKKESAKINIISWRNKYVERNNSRIARAKFIGSVDDLVRKAKQKDNNKTGN